MTRLLRPILLVIATLLPGAAHAQTDGDAVDDAMSEEGLAIYQQAREARVAGDYRRCLARARAAWALSQKGGIAAIRGECAAALGEWVEAATYLDQCIETPPKQRTDEFMTHIAELLADARMHVAQVTLRIEPADAAVTVDDRSLSREPGVTLGHLYLLPGTHRVRADHPGRVTAEEEIVATAGGEHVVRLSLAPIGPAVPAPVPSGDESAHPHPVVMALGMGIGGAAVVAGVITIVYSGRTKSEVEDLQAVIDFAGTSCVAPEPTFSTTCGDLRATLQRKDDLHNASIGLLVGGGTLVVVSAIYALATMGGADEPAVVAVPTVAPDAAGLSIFGRF